MFRQCRMFPAHWYLNIIQFYTIHFAKHFGCVNLRVGHFQVSWIPKRSAGAIVKTQFWYKPSLCQKDISLQTQQFTASIFLHSLRLILRHVSLHFPNKDCWKRTMGVHLRMLCFLFFPLSGSYWFLNVIVILLLPKTSVKPLVLLIFPTRA